MKDNESLPACGPAGVPQQCSTNPFHRILVVDDDSDLRMLYAEALAQPGYFVDVAKDGAAGWEALQANPYDLLIVENDIPHLSGIELVRKLRSARIALPVVMAAGRLPSYELAKNPSLKLAAALVKPFAVGALLDTVRHVLSATDSPAEQIYPLPDWRDQPPAHALRL
jgi:DNA-binding response OmpR family regulator